MVLNVKDKVLVWLVIILISLMTVVLSDGKSKCELIIIRVSVCFKNLHLQYIELIL